MGISSDFILCMICLIPAVSSLPAVYRTGDGVTQFVSVQAGSSLHLVESTFCMDTENRHYELRNREDQIGSYDLGLFKGRLQFQNRLTFTENNCTFTVSDVMSSDTGVYTLITMIDKNNQLETHETKFNVSVFDNVPSSELPENNTDIVLSSGTPDNNTAIVLGFFSFCLSMAPTVNAFCSLLNGFISWKDERIKKAVINGLVLNGVISLFCQVTSIVLSFVLGNNYNSLFIVAVILFVTTFGYHMYKLLRLALQGFNCRKLQKLWKCCFWLLLLVQVAFTFFIGLHYYLTYGQIHLEKKGYLIFVSFVVFLGILAILCLMFYFCSPLPKTNEEKKPEESSMIPASDGEASSTSISEF
uniref:Uncharacterized protein n=1 Tax=Pyxicephalus adspersus TaxID=30357 RepID=A0AAV3ADX1_PYXAD|nr:TPA: hypothetical protein GDO54_009727 [Pyxicephalus adspersus]